MADKTLERRIIVLLNINELDQLWKSTRTHKNGKKAPHRDAFIHYPPSLFSLGCVMAEAILGLPSSAVITGWDFSTGSVKALAFDLQGNVLADVRFPTDLWTEDGVSELNLMLLEGQARATTRALAAQLRDEERLNDWLAGGISATHHSAGRVDNWGNQVRRAICWNDQTLAEYHKIGMERLGGAGRVAEILGGPYAVRYSLSHLIKDEATLSHERWLNTYKILLHGPLAGGYLTGNFDATSISSAASTGIMNFEKNEWARPMLDAIANPEYRELAWNQLPKIHHDYTTPIGVLTESIALDAGLPNGLRPAVYPTLDDQAAGLVGGGATDSGHVAVILGNSAVVNSSAGAAPRNSNLDAMKLNWGPWLWMRCYSNGAQFLDRVLGKNPDWAKLEAAARQLSAGSNGVSVLPFVLTEPSIGIFKPRVEWFPNEPTDGPTRYRASLESLAFLIALGVKEHENAGQKITRITVSGGIARSELMLEILASVLNREVERLASDEGPALGAAVLALAGAEQKARREKGITQPFTVADAVQHLVKFKGAVKPRSEWVADYQKGLAEFSERLK